MDGCQPASLGLGQVRSLQGVNILKVYPHLEREVSAIYEDLDLPPTGNREGARPYVIINTVSSVDGRTVMEGKAAGIGSTADRRTMRTLRSKVDAVMIGAGTLRAEKLSLGLDPTDGVRQPLAIIVTDTGDVPLEEQLIVKGGQEILILLSDAAPRRVAERLRGLAPVMSAPASSTGAVDLQAALRALQAERGVESLVLEGGPGLNHALISRQLVDELFLTVAPELLGGTAAQTLTLLRGPEIPARDRPVLELLSIHVAESELFLRYSLTRTPPGSA
ncbi:MAG: bifunctional deaminase-reductase-like protein [Rubrobacteraceae bacterium]|nr:bifunctional deaminase-reductase-like protein [Rubrobacteraceae bacterium]